MGLEILSTEPSMSKSRLLVQIDRFITFEYVAISFDTFFQIFFLIVWHDKLIILKPLSGIEYPA